MTRWIVFARRWALMLLALGAWVAATQLHAVNPLALPTPVAFARAAWAYVSESYNYVHIAYTIGRAGLGLLVSMLVGIPAGVAAGRTRWLHDLLQLPVDFFRSIPSSALFFLFILTFGVGEVSKVMVVVYGCSLILFINAAYGAAPTPDKNFRLDLMRAFGASAAQRFWLVTIPEALPAIAAGVRTCLSLAFVLVIVTEMFLGAQQGLGKQLYDFYLGYRIPEMWVCLAVLGVTGSAANVAGIAIERRVTHWRARHVEEFADGI